MANNAWTHPTWQETPQAKTFTITGVGGLTDVWTFTLTEDDAVTTTVTYTNDGSPTTAEIVAGLVAAWNATTHPDAARILATNSASTAVDTTANIGNNDVALARNWSTNAILANTNDLIVEPGDVHLKYGLNQSSVALADVKIAKGCKSDFGRCEFGRFHYFRMDPDSFDYRGNGSLAMFDIGGAAISPYIESYGSPGVNGRHVVYIKGSAIATLKVARGNVGVAALDADTATVTTILCGLSENLQSDVDMTIGSGVTLTTLTQSGGKCLLKCAATTVNVFPGCTLTTEGTGAITTLNVHAGAKVYLKSTGTIGTLNLWGDADFSRDNSAKTVTTLNLKRGGTLVKHDSITIATFTPPSSSGGAVDTIKAA